jgi:peroxiredoxin
MMSGNFMPVVYGDINHKPQAIVFRTTSKEEKEQMRAALSHEDPNANFEAGVFAEEFVTTNLNGEKISLTNLKGKIVVLNFWFTTCQPCISEIPELNKLVKKYKNQNVAFIAVTFNKEIDLNKFFSNHKFDFTIVADLDLIKQYKVDSYPTSMIIDKNGEIIFRKVGVYTEEIDTKIGLLLKK